MPTTPKPKVLEINCETGEETLRDMTAAEIAQYEADQANAPAEA